MINKYKCIKDLEKVLLQAMKSEKYDPPVELEQNFSDLLAEALEQTDLKPYVNQINYIITCYMSLADVLDLVRKGELD